MPSPWRLCLLVVVAALVLAGPAAGQSGLEIMQKQRELHGVRDEEEQQALTLVDRHGATRQRRLVLALLRTSGGLDKILVRFTAPRDIENTALLTWEARDGSDDQWLYLPAVRKPKRIAASHKQNRFMGTDFSYEDLRHEALTLHRYAVIASESVDGQDCFVIEAVPATERQAADSGYSKRRLWVRRDNLATVRREYYDRRGRLEKIETLRRLVNIRGTAWRANEVEMRDVQQGSTTRVAVERRVVDAGLLESFFSEAGLLR
jgi:outer membrane lipoprotein-sorting protein